MAKVPACRSFVLGDVGTVLHHTHGTFCACIDNISFVSLNAAMKCSHSWWSVIVNAVWRIYCDLYILILYAWYAWFGVDLNDFFLSCFCTLACIAGATFVTFPVTEHFNETAHDLHATLEHTGRSIWRFWLSAMTGSRGVLHFGICEASQEVQFWGEHFVCLKGGESL